MRSSNNHISEQLLQDFSLGKDKAFDSIFGALYASICYFSLEIVGDKLAAQDIAEDAFIKLWHYRATVRDPKSWLYRVARNASFQWLKEETRRRSAENLTVENNLSWDNVSWETMVQAEVLRELDIAINQLPPQRQRVVRMLYKEGKSVKEVASELKVSKSAVLEHKTKAILFLKKIVPFIFVMICFFRWS